MSDQRAPTPDFVTRYIDLAQPRLGARVISASDDFFAAKERLIEPAEPAFDPNHYDDHGKYMDGWESRRRRDAGHDWCVVKICAGRISGVDVDTRHFTGNYPPECSLEACRSDETPADDTQWVTLVERSPLTADSHHYFPVDNPQAFTHVRLNIFPDGGVARLRVYGEAERDWTGCTETVDLIAQVNGGRGLACNDMHYGHMCNLIAPGKSTYMGDGWETRRRRDPGHDWVLLRLGHPGHIETVEVDTAFFKGNYPDTCSLEGGLFRSDQEALDCTDWQPLLDRVPLGPHQVHTFALSSESPPAVSHVRFNIYPDGGVSRLRCYGRIAR